MLVSHVMWTDTAWWNVQLVPPPSSPSRHPLRPLPLFFFRLQDKTCSSECRVTGDAHWLTVQYSSASRYSWRPSQPSASFLTFRIWKLIEACRWLQKCGTFGAAIRKVDATELRFYALILTHGPLVLGICSWPPSIVAWKTWGGWGRGIILQGRIKFRGTGETFPNRSSPQTPSIRSSLPADQSRPLHSNYWPRKIPVLLISFVRNAFPIPNPIFPFFLFVRWAVQPSWRSAESWNGRDDVHQKQERCQ